MPSGSHVAVDGKALRGSRDEQGIVHMVSAFAAKAGIVLTQRVFDSKSNEITAIPNLLSFLELKGARRHHRCDGMSEKYRQGDYRSRWRLRLGA